MILNNAIVKIFFIYVRVAKFWIANVSPMGNLIYNVQKVKTYMQNIICIISSLLCEMEH